MYSIDKMMHAVSGTDPITIGALNVTRISNLREILSNINQSIELIRDNGHWQMAEVLEELGQIIVTAPHLHARQPIIEVLRTIAWEASLPPVQRQMGIVTAALEYLSLLLIADNDALDHLKSLSEDLRGFFETSAKASK